MAPGYCHAMSGLDFDPGRFYEAYPRFLDSSETGHWNERLHARFQALIHANRQRLEGARVLDLASHDGRFSFAAVACGAAQVVGIDVKDHLVEVSREHFAAYGVSPDRYEFLVGDMYDWIPRLGQFDVVLCFGIMYHVRDHLRLLDLIAATEPGTLIVDTHVSSLEGCVVQFHDPALPLQPPPPGAELEGYPTKMALEAMLTSFGWQVDFVDWAGSGLLDRPGMKDYRTGRRVSAVVSCPERLVPVALREQAVLEVFDAPGSREERSIAVHLIASRYEIPPPALRTWVRRAEQARWLEAAAEPTDR